MTVFSHQIVTRSGEKLKKRVYFWDRKESPGQDGISLSELFIFFKIKQFSNLRDHCNSYDDYEYWSNRSQTILKSFIDFPINLSDSDPWKCVPRQIAEAYSEAKEQVLVEGLSYVSSQVSSEEMERIQDFFEFEFKGRVLEKMDYQIKTSVGMEEISLLFAENFRFKTNSGTFHLFGLKKEDRDIIVPHDEDSMLFVADFRQFEFRSFLKLQDMNHYLKDENIYQTLGDQIGMSGNDFKVGIISSIYGEQKNKKLQDFLQKDKLIEKFEDNNVVWTEEGPVFIPDQGSSGKRIHTLVQTVSQYVYLRKLDKVLELLHNKGSKFVFPLHDCVIISMKNDEPELIDGLLDILEDDDYKIKCYMGPNFRDAQEI